MKPVILISAAIDDEYDSFQKKYRIGAQYADYVSAAGAVPILACGGDVNTYLQIADGILFSGGPDIEPACYGEHILNDTVSKALARDEEEFQLFSAFYQSGKPIFGICRGIQLINVALGGSLYQDIPSQIPTEIVHSANGTHKVEVSNALYELFRKKTLVVNSYHHQCIKKLSDGLIANAISEDGLIEGIESPNGQIFAVQWHPERISGALQCGERDDMMPFFEEIVRRTKKG